MSIERGVRQDETWITADPVVGCAKNCSYCFLQGYNKTSKPGMPIMSAEKAIDNVLSFKNYRSESPVMVGSETDVFMNRSNINYFTEFFKKYAERELPNPLVFSTKSKIPDEFIELVKDNEAIKTVFYLSFSGLPQTIEPAVNSEQIKSNFERLKEAEIPTIHYWRPFLPQNSHREKIREIIDYVAQQATCSVAVGLKTNDEIIKHLVNVWPELGDESDKVNAAADVWPEGVKDYIEQYVRTNFPEYPLYWVNSCALAYALQKSDFNAMFEGTACDANHCPSDQRERCAIDLLGYKPSSESVRDALSQMGLDYEFRIDENEKMVHIIGDVSHGQLIYLRQKLNYPIKIEGDFSSTNEWAGHVANKESVHVPYATENFDIDVIWERAQYTRKLFRSVETAEWGAEQYALELMVQIGHLSDIILRQDYKLNNRTKEENASVIADELSDVILNIFSIADTFSISVPMLLREKSGLRRDEIVDSRKLLEGVENEKSVLRSMLEVSKQSALLAEMVTGVEKGEISKEELKGSLLGAFQSCFSLLNFYNVNLHKSFDKMVLESETFVEKNKLT
jgi:DNA repair photolyase